MKPFKKILFPVDLSDVSPKIAPWVIMVAEKFEAEICLLFVVRAFEYYTPFCHVPGEIESFVSGIIKGAGEKIEEFVKTDLKDCSHCKTKVVSGDPAHGILDYIASEDIDLVIMGTHGRKGLDRVFFGSVADRVVKMSSVPVLTINPHRVQAKETEAPSSKG
jgi:nucleotide-binding universal stress UspA family protein